MQAATVNRRGFTPDSELRTFRRKRGVRLQEVSTVSGINLYRCSVIERDPTKAKPGEIEAMRAAVAELAEGAV
ncbi:MAG TPA: hypothetical protein VMO47_10485 [Rhodothermales bacterium]|nr:hypothetical protein [Rhodothermales bacterium]